MSDMENQTGTPVMPMSRALLYYFGCLVGFLLVFVGYRHVTWMSSWVPIFAYLGAGFFLNRTVLRALIAWHPVYDCRMQEVEQRRSSCRQHAAERGALEVPPDDSLAVLLSGAVYPARRGQAFVSPSFAACASMTETIVFPRIPFKSSCPRLRASWTR